MKKSIPVVTVAEPEEAARLAGLPVGGDGGVGRCGRMVREGLLGFCADVALVVMRQLMDAELTERIGRKHPKLPRSGR